MTINPTKIDVPFGTLDKIIHLSDVHIRLLKRHAEYREVFNQLYEDLFSHGTMFCNSIIVVTGDLVHAKTDLSPEMVTLASEFLKKLADIAPTFVIVGNHDLNLANRFRLDALTPLIENLAHPNLYYLRNSGVYRVANADLVVYSILDEPAEWPNPHQVVAPNKIVLCHAPIHNAQTDTGYTISNRSMELSLFDGFDIALLGDIHRHQTLQQYDDVAEKPMVAYAGSMIQQSHGEALKGHGWLEWNVPTREFTFHELKNTYGYVTLVIENEKVPDLSGIPKNVRLRVFVKDIDGSKVKKIQSILQKRFTLQEFTINKLRDSDVLVGGKQSAELVDVRNLDVQSKLIDEYLLSHHAVVDEKMRARILDLNKRLNGLVPQEEMVRNIQWRPLTFEFENMYSYGAGNKITFDGMKGVFGLFAPNATGKSAAFDALMFCLFDKTPRAFKAAHIMNNRKDDFECTLMFDIGGQEYGIRRMGERKKTGDVKADVDFWKIEKGEQVSLNAEDRRATNAVIRRYVGNYDDFILTNLSVQNMNSIFIDKGQSDRKDLLSQFMGINIFDSLYNLALDEMKEAAGAHKMLSKEDLSRTLTDAQTQIERLELDKKIVEDTLANKEEGVQSLEVEIGKLKETKVPLHVSSTDIKGLEAAHAKFTGSLADLGIQKNEMTMQLDTIAATSGSLVTSLQPYVKSDIETQYTTFTKTKSAYQEAEREVKLLTRQIEKDQSRIDHITTHEYDPSCKFCVKNNHSLVETAVQLTQDLAVNTHHRDEIAKAMQMDLPVLATGDVLVLDYGKWTRLSKELNAADRELLVLKASLGDVNSSIIRRKAQIHEAEKQIKEYYASVDVIEKNAHIDAKIAMLEQQKSSLQRERRLVEAQYHGLLGDLQVQKTDRKQAIKQIEDMKELEQSIGAYEYYVDTIKRDGIPYGLIAKVIPTIEAEANNILSQIADFTIALEVDGKNINGRLIYDDDRQWPLEMSSGMERFLGGLAIRAALITISNLPKPNFLIIDEGLSVLTAENLMSMTMLFSILKTQFDFVVVISHLDTVRDMVDHLLEIELGTDGYNKITY